MSHTKPAGEGTSMSFWMNWWRERSSGSYRLRDQVLVPNPNSAMTWGLFKLGIVILVSSHVAGAQRGPTPPPQAR